MGIHDDYIHFFKIIEKYLWCLTNFDIKLNGKNNNLFPSVAPFKIGSFIFLMSSFNTLYNHTTTHRPREVR